MTKKAPGSASQIWPWQCLNFLPEPHGQGSLRPTLRPSRTTVSPPGDTGPAVGASAAAESAGEAGAGRKPAARAAACRRRAFRSAIAGDDRLRRRVLRLQLARHLPLALALLLLDLRFRAHLQARQQRHRVVLDAVEQRAEELERLALVLLLRVLLRVGAQVDALPQVIHRREVLAPVAIELLQHHGLLEVPHDRRADGRDLGLVRVLDRLHDAVAQAGLGDLVIGREPGLRVDRA